MKKEEYREARREFGETAAGLGKEVRKEAREAYRNVRESADTRMKEIKEELRETERMEKILGDGCSSHNIREARETARRAKDMVNMEVITARADFDDDKADFQGGGRRSQAQDTRRTPKRGRSQPKHTTSPTRRCGRKTTSMQTWRIRWTA